LIDFLFDENLTLKEKGFLAMVYLSPADVEINKDYIQANTLEGRTAIYNTARSLEEKGILKRNKIRTDDKKFYKTVWNISYNKED
jgi:hypothetical protein